MPYIEQVNESEATGELAKMYESCQQRAGFVANILKVQSQDPAILRESLRFYIRLMKSPNSLHAAQREMLAAVVSNVNDCYY
ncbi:MAG: peroxidase [Fuerstiella sp.]